MSDKMKLILTATIYFGNLTVGFLSVLIPASLLELSRKFDTDISTISKVFTIMTFSFLLGAIASGFILDFLNRQMSSAFMLMTLGTTFILFPLVGSLKFFFILASIAGVMAAGFNTTQIVWIIDLWKANPAVYIQIQHFTFALGTVVSPLVMKFFLPQNNTVHDKIPQDLTLGTSENTSKINELSSAPHLYVPYLIGGSSAIFCGSLFFISYFFTPHIQKPEECPEEKVAKPEPGVEPPKASKFYTLLLIILSALVIGAYQGMEACSFQFMPTFTNFIALNLSQAEGSLVLSCLAAAFTLGRSIGIFVILKVLPEILLVVNLVLVLLGNSLLLFFGNSSLPALWCGTVILGIGISTIVPSFYGFVEKHTQVTNTFGAVMNVALGLAPTIYPIIIGDYIAQTPFILMYTNYFSLGMCATSFLIIYLITRKRQVGADDPTSVRV